jgi:plastocyanin
MRIFKSRLTLRFIGLLVLSGILAIMSPLFVSSGIAHADATKNILFVIGQSQYAVDGQSYTMDAASFIENGRTYVPVRYLGAALGMSNDNIQWDPNTMAVMMNYNGTKMQLNIGSQNMIVNGQSQAIDVAPLIQNGRTCLPARYVAESFGYTVSFDQATQTVSISNVNTSSSHTVTIQGFAFNPDVLTINKGDTVVWVNNDSVEHTVTAQNSAFDSGPLASGATFTHVFDTSGTYQYSCTIHPTMTGEVVVQ